MSRPRRQRPPSRRRAVADHLSSENAALARQVESMAMRIESLAEELAKPEDVRLREVVDALDGRAVIFDGLGARVTHLLDEMDKWIVRAGEAERMVEAARRSLSSVAESMTEHEWAPHEREGWSVCSRCGMVRNYDRETTTCSGALPKIRQRSEIEDCGQDGVCKLSPGCNRHWEERNRELVRENASLSSQVEAMAMRIESLAEELAKPEDVRLREVLDALDGQGGRVVNFCTMTHEEALAELVRLDVARWGEAEREASIRMHRGKSRGLLINAIVHHQGNRYGDAFDAESKRDAERQLTAADRAVLRR